MSSTGTRYALEVQPQLPQEITRLNDFANDLFFSWENQISQLFDYLDSNLWHTCGYNPKLFLRRVSQTRLNEAPQDRAFMENYHRCLSSYDSYQGASTHADVAKILDPEKDLVAYFCAEFGFHESLPIYSGGLGILAGDHCKAATDLGVPFVAIGLLYRQGYFIQTIDDQGRQLANYTPTQFDDLPIRLKTNVEGSPILIDVPIQSRKVYLQIWEVKAGHIKLYLLDSDISQNNESDRRITYQLYGGDKTTRIQQEIVLGIGGVRAIRALDLQPTVWHINEGHAAFQILERCREHVSSGNSFDTALEMAAASTVFTTHTPVAAGHDIFDHGLLLDHLSQLIRELDIKDHDLLSLGQNTTSHSGFNQTALALRGSRHHNGVSRIHGDTASRMEHYIWPEIPHDENPITYVTNGIHVPTFLARDWANLFDMRFGADWKNELRNPDYWHRVYDIPDHIYWSVHQSLKLELFDFLHQRMVKQHRRNGCSEAQIERLTRYVRGADNRVLVMGFARRFATYKRGALLFSDPERLKKLLNDEHRPVMLIFAGKAHPKDQPGQELIQKI
ncbi:MAG: alpha-glucan family phosphorylase, partial [Gammaproteobacteria bacterium]|nr:alpha-glucan family phosphorylase [Gammaproteobacteria bacterium]